MIAVDRFAQAVEELGDHLKQAVRYKGSDLEVWLMTKGAAHFEEVQEAWRGVEKAQLDEVLKEVARAN